jgi:glycolate oxidase
VKPTPEHLEELRALLGDDGVLASEAALFTYEADALTLERARPDVVVLPRDTDQVSAVLRWASARGLPVTPRGAGTGLAGGATPERGGLVLSVNRMDQLLRVDPDRLFAWVQPGLVNLHLSQQVAAHGLYFAPDPASQQVSTLGGNVAANSGGPHCLKYGVTFNHILAVVAVLANGDVVPLGSEAPDGPDSDLMAAVVGSEGTIAVVSEICVRLLPRPEAVKTMLFDFATLEEGCRAVSAAIARGIVPAAMEIMDRHTVAMVEAWLHLGLPLDAGCVLLIEVDGPAASLAPQVETLIALAKASGARATRVAQDEAERLALWKGRKSAFGAYGRSRSGFYIMDGVVPRTRLAEALATISRLCEERGLSCGHVFHAGDGNLHPHVLFDAADPHQQQVALETSHDILRMCIRLGGTISGEHGVGIEKRPMMRELYAPEDLALMTAFRDAWDGSMRLNPCKVYPGGGGCAEGPPGHARPAQLGGMRPTGTGDGPWI